MWLKDITVSLALFDKGFYSIWFKCSYTASFVFSSNRDYVNFHLTVLTEFVILVLYLFCCQQFTRHLYALIFQSLPYFIQIP